MIRIRTVSLTAVIAVSISCAALYADERQEMQARFSQLKANCLQAISSGQVKSMSAHLKGATGKFSLVESCNVVPAAPIVPGQPPIQLGVKIWGQLVDSNGQLGGYVNLMKHKWQPKERFYLYLETAVPLQMGLFQNYPESRPASRQVSPDERFPETFGAIMPGAPFRFPVLIQMDDDLRNEQMSIVLARCDAPGLPYNGTSATASATATAYVDSTGPSCSVRVNASASAAPATTTSVAPIATPAATSSEGRPATALATSAAVASSALPSVVEPDGTLKGPAAEQAKGVMKTLSASLKNSRPLVMKGQKFSLVAAPPANLPSVSNQVQDVECVILGPGNLAQIELTLFK